MHSILRKIDNRLTRLRLKPIRVFCFHEVSNRDEGSPDWVPTDCLKSFLLGLKEDGYTFISLREAYKHICNDYVRTRKYAVLTADDGLRCQWELLSWFEENEIPITLCLNVTSPQLKKCGLPQRQWHHIEDAETEQHYAEMLYVSDSELNTLMSMNVSYALHGVNHDESAVEITLEAFERDIEGCVNRYVSDQHYVPFYAYKYGKHTAETDEIVWRNNLVPILSDGKMNYKDAKFVHREIIETIYKQCQQK